MNKKIIKSILSIVTVTALVSTVFVGCQKSKTASMEGVWTQKNHTADEVYHKAYIENNEINVFWIDETKNTQSLYWSGSFDASAKGKYISKANAEKNGSSILASTDAEKEFDVSKKAIKYEASALNSTKQIELVKTGEKEDISKEFKKETSISNEAATDLTDETTVAVVNENQNENKEENISQENNSNDKEEVTASNNTNSNNKKPSSKKPSSSSSTNKKPSSKKPSSSSSTNKKPSKKPSGGSSSSGSSGSSSSSKPKPTKPVKHVTAKEVQDEVNAYIRNTLGVKINTSLRPNSAGWDGEIAGEQVDLDSGYTLRACKGYAKMCKDEMGDMLGSLYCYYEGTTFYVLYMGGFG